MLVSGAAAAAAAVSAVLFGTSVSMGGGLLPLINKLETRIGDPTHSLPTQGQNTFLQGNPLPYGPVAEEVPDAVACEVVGQVPPDLHGEFLRTGPNPKFAPTAGYHWFDGDGMVHAVRLRGADAAPTYSARYVDTIRLQEEMRTGRSQYVKIGDMADKLALARIALSALKVKLGLLKDAPGTANTALAWHGGRVLALHEGDAPYHLRVNAHDGTVDTVGRHAFEGGLVAPFTAHPKVDPATGIMYGIGYQVDAKPHLSFHVISPEGALLRSFPISDVGPRMMHDFMISEHYAVIPDFPFKFDPALAVQDTIPFVLDKEGTARIGLLPLDATDDSGIKWFELPLAVGMYHGMNAWETRDPATGAIATVDVVISEYEHLSLQTFYGHCEMGQQKARAVRYTLDVASGAVTRAPYVEEPPEALEFPQVNKRYLGRRARHSWWSQIATHLPLPLGIMKATLSDDDSPSPLHSAPSASGRTVWFGEGWYGGECIFVPAASAAGKSAGAPLDEDDGYVLVYVVNTKEERRSELRIYNAKTMADTPVAAIRIDRRVPLGFHALYLTEEELAAQV